MRQPVRKATWRCVYPGIRLLWSGSLILLRPCNFHTQFFGCMQRPIGMPQKFSSHQHGVRLSGGNDLLGLHRMSDEAHRPCCHAHSFAYDCCKRDLEARSRRNRCARSHPPSTQSVHESRTKRGRWSGQIARTAPATLKGNGSRFSRLPPYSSPRRLEGGERNSWAR